MISVAEPLTHPRARAWFAFTAIVVFVGLIVQVAVVVPAKPGSFFPTTAGRVFNVFCFFTIESNLIVGATCLLLALRLDRSSTVFKSFYLIGIVGITITGVVYHAVISKVVDFESWALVADNLLHTVVPIMAVVGWLMFGPRGLTSRRVMWLSVLFPVCYMVFTAIRGAIVHFYPYQFADVITLGYPRVVINGVWISILYLGVAAGATAIDQRLTRPDR